MPRCAGTPATMPSRSTLLGALLVHRTAASPSTALAPYDPAAVIQPYNVAERRYRFANAGNTLTLTLPFTVTLTAHPHHSPLTTHHSP